MDRLYFFRRRRSVSGHGRRAPAAALFSALFSALLSASAALLALPGAGRAQSLDLAGALRHLDPDGLCADVRIVGQCRCGGVVCGVRERRFVPVAFVETTIAPGDSLLGPTGMTVPDLFGTVSSALSATDNTSEAHVWVLGPAWTAAVPCLACSAASAAVPISVDDPAAALCGPAGAVAQAIGALSGAAAALPVPRLAYASELDWRNWRTGCRDLADPSWSAGAAALACRLPAPTVALPGIVGSAGQRSQDPACIGSWGPMRPRQMRDIGPVPLLHSAKTAVRAMSIAREQLGTFKYPVDTEGKLQQVYPGLSACFGVGQLPLPQAPASPLPARTSADGRYGWIYWRPATCCAGLPGAARCLRPPLP